MKFFTLFTCLLLSYQSADISDDSVKKYNTLSKEDKAQAVNKLVKYISFNTAHPNPDYSTTVLFLKSYSQELGLKFYEFKCPPSNTPSVVLTLPGENPKLPALVLNSHYDVVPAVKESWKYDPFNATIVKDKDGNEVMYGRGTTDNKGLGVIHLEAIRALMARNKNGFKRTVHLLMVGDEEVGGKLGMGCFVNSDQWKSVIGETALVLGEGLLNPTEKVYAYYNERVQKSFKAIAYGKSGHASYFISDLATDKMDVFKEKMKQFRKSEERRMKLKNLTLGEVTTSNLNLVSAGTAINVVPDKIEVTYDVRATPLSDLKKMREKFTKWAKQSNVTLEILKDDIPYSSEVNDNPIWLALKAKASEFGLPLDLGVFPGATDLRYLRARNIPSLGLTPINFHISTAHGNDEFLKLDSFYKAIDFFIHCLPAMLN